MPPEYFPNLVWNALHTIHANFAVKNSDAARYHADVVPYAALADPTHADLSPLAELLAPNDRVYLIGPQPAPTRLLEVGPPLECFQMFFPDQPPPESAAPTDPAILSITPSDLPDMAALTDLAFPGFSARARTRWAHTMASASAATSSPWPEKVWPFPALARSAP
jgi:hypothetical protein